VAELLNEMILVRLKSLDRFSSVVGGSDMAAMIDMEAQKQALGCNEDSCLAELGGALGVPYMLNASIGKMGSLIVVTLKVIAVEEAKVEVRELLRAADEGALANGIDGLVDKAVLALLGAAQKTGSEASADKPQPEAEAPKTAALPEASASKGSSSFTAWGGVAMSMAGAGYALWRQQIWLAAQETFDDRVQAGALVDTQDINDLQARADLSNVEVGAGMAVSGLGLVMIWWGW
jgi:hypothetical protein